VKDIPKSQVDKIDIRNILGPGYNYDKYWRVEEIVKSRDSNTI
jgi:hypothetical protein